MIDNNGKNDDDNGVDVIQVLISIFIQMNSEFPTTTDEITHFVKTASIDDIMQIASKMRRQVEALCKKEEKLAKKMEKEQEKREKRQQKELEKEEKRKLKEKAHLEKIKKLVTVPDSESDSESGTDVIDSEDESTVKIVKRGVGRPPKERKPRKPRAPTAYNLFLKEKLVELSKSHPDLTTQERMKLVASAWREKKCNTN